MNDSQRITIEPSKRGGQPCIRGMRITVYSEQEILEDYREHRSIRIAV